MTIDKQVKFVSVSNLKVASPLFLSSVVVILLFLRFDYVSVCAHTAYTPHGWMCACASEENKSKEKINERN